LTRAPSPGAAAGLLWTALGSAALWGLALALPLLREPVFGWLLAYALAISSIGATLYGFAALARHLPTPRLLLFGALAAIPGFLLALLVRPETLAEGYAPLTSSALSLANVLRALAGASLGISLSRYVTSPGVALLIAAVATASDLFSVFAGPTGALLREDSPVLDLLLLILPSFGEPLGFALGVSDLVFLALFLAISCRLGLRYLPTLASGCLAILLAMILGLSLGRPLPALPFISLSFVLANADLLYSSLFHRTP
jgi:hypothetical protein